MAHKRRKRTTRPITPRHDGDPERIMRIDEICARLGGGKQIDRSTLWRMAHDGRFPALMHVPYPGLRYKTFVKWLDEQEQRATHTRRRSPTRRAEKRRAATQKSA